MQSAVDFKLIIVSDNDAICAAYLKHFRGERNVEIKKSTVAEAGPADLLILPLTTGLGLLPASSIHRDLTSYVSFLFVARMLRLATRVATQ
jgi:hypothetical protein